MTHIQEWFRRLNALDESADDATQGAAFRVLATSALDIDGSIIRVEPTGRVAESFGSMPAQMSVLHLLDEGGPANVRRSQALATQLGAVITLALGRRVRVAADEIVARMDGADHVNFIPSGLNGRELNGPIEGNQKRLVETMLTRIAGLSDDDATPILAASELHYAATQLFDVDLHTAFTLLVAGLETLAGQFEAQPATWDTFNDAAHWDTVFERLGLDGAQAEAMREELLVDKHLRLRQRFATYTLRMLTPGFWRHAVRDFTPSYTFAAASSSFTGLREVKTPTPMEVIVPRDPAVLRRRLLACYDARSTFVHAGTKAMDADAPLLSRSGAPIRNNSPLEFTALRRIREWVLRQEIAQRSRPAVLPDCILGRA
ncbi:hypothetical protein [Microbacterium sp. NPDC087665]|uniref:hypothetical protein n=1 Tax=Microbacterium sp. NPDC087665 TaxID=3364194 RepID=UPI00380FAF6D